MLTLQMRFCRISASLVHGLGSGSCDVNSDGVVNFPDLTIVAEHPGESLPIAPRTDVNRDGKVNILDLVIVSRHFGEEYR